MAKSDKVPPLNKQLKYAKPFGDTITAEMERIMNEAPKREHGTALYAMVKVMTIIWINLMRDLDMEPLQAIVMLTEIWKDIEKTDAMLEQMRETGGLH